MADADGGRHRDSGADADPLLVRPYILGTPELTVPGSDPGHPGETWPQPITHAEAGASAPAGGPARARVPARVVPGDLAGHDAGRGGAGRVPRQPVGGFDGLRRSAGTTPDRSRRRLRLVAAAAVTGALAVTAAYATSRPDDSGTATTAQPTAIVPTAASPSETSPSGTFSGGTASNAPPGTGTGAVPAAPDGRSTPPGQPPAPATGTPSGSAATAPATTPGAPNRSEPPAPPPEATQQPLMPSAPAARTGSITGPGGRCLDVEGDGKARGHRLALTECDGGPAQTWTLSTDGTLRTAGRCGQAGNGGSVKLVDCDSQAVGKWRRADDRTLLNVGTGNCLTDPENGSRNGSTLVVRACDGGIAQRWSTP